MLSKDKLKQILVEQRERLLKVPLGVEREVLSIIEKKRKLPHIVVITGLRRCGKSTLLRQIIKKFYSDTDFYYINFEDERLFNFKSQDFNDIYEVLVELFSKKKTFFLDEVQNIKNFELFVRRFYDEGFKFFITGSNAELLSKELGTKLTGRHVDINLTPFSFREFLKFKKVEFDTLDIYKTEFKARIKNNFKDYLNFGGMPEYLIFDDIEILERIYEDIIMRDVVVRHNVENIFELKTLYSYLITNFSKKFSFNSVKNAISLSSVNTIKKYISYFEETYFLSVINKFDYSAKKILRSEKKVYVLDSGFIKALSTSITKDKGWLLENLVFNVLNNKFKVYYYSNGTECDFLIVKNKSIESAIQVTWELNGNKKREFDGLYDTMEKFNIKTGLILTFDQEETIRKEGKKIEIKPVWKWLLT